jgi:DNA-binding Lrp family transcriptional regulator
METHLYNVQRSLEDVLRISPRANANMSTALNLEFCRDKGWTDFTVWWPKSRMILTTPTDLRGNVCLDHQGKEITDPDDVQQFREETMQVAKYRAIESVYGICKELHKAVGNHPNRSVMQGNLSSIVGFADYENECGLKGNRNMLMQSYGYNAVELGLLNRVKKGGNVFYEPGKSNVTEEIVAKWMGTDTSYDLDILMQERKRSKGETTVAAILNQLERDGVIRSYTIEQTFDELKDKRHLRFDFKVNTMDPEKEFILIEVQGKQHYEHVPHFHKTAEEFETLQHHDLMKKAWCEDERIDLLELCVESSNKNERDRIAREIKKRVLSR